MGAVDRVKPSMRNDIGGLLLRAYRTLAFYGVLGVFGVVFLGLNVPTTVLYWCLPRRLAPRVGQWIISRGFRMLLGLMRVTGLATFDLAELDALRDEPGLVIAPNHPSLIDVMLVISRLPRVVCIAKASLWDNPAIGASARLAGYIRNDHSQFRLIARAAEAMRAGQQLLIFPEGTRTDGPEPVGPMKGGFALMARRAGAPVQTVLLDSNTAYLCKDWPLLRQPPLPLHFRARLGDRFDATGDADILTQRLDQYFRRELTGRDRPPG